MKQIVDVWPATKRGEVVRLAYGIGDEKGAVVLVVNTGWGPDKNIGLDYYPMAMGLWKHTVTKPPVAEDYNWCYDKHCQFVGQECWSQIISDTLASELLVTLRREGLAKLWVALESLYREYFE